MDPNQQYQHHQMHPQHMGNGPTTEKMPAEMQYGGYEQQQQYHHQQQYAGGDPHAAGHQQYQPGGSGGYAATQAAPAAGHLSKGSSSKTICGMKRALFLVLLLLLLLLLGLVIGLGAGLGVSQSNLHAKESELAAAKSNGGTANNTQYTSDASSSETKFTVYCGMDFGDNEGAKNLESQNATSMPDCMDACAKTRDCQGAGWGTLGEAVDEPHMCYMKTNLSKSHGADKGWTFAVLSSVNVTISQPSD
ncbi:hypothetical protein PG994_008370 [Apiospora phragmitis]|uniref:Apple domain-containing protein n=1 Tax=Apiospora phragmitis TaxID=2905665 RepID=A0ABR1UST8_9PEZI